MAYALLRDRAEALTAEWRSAAMSAPRTEDSRPLSRDLAEIAAQGPAALFHQDMDWAEGHADDAAVSEEEAEIEEVKRHAAELTLLQGGGEDG